MALIYVKQSVWEADFILTLGLINIQYFMLYFSQHKVNKIIFEKSQRGLELNHLPFLTVSYLYSLQNFFVEFPFFFF